jgi:uncharacterized protein
MKLRNLLHIHENNVHLFGSLTPPFFFRASDIMNEFLQLCDNNSLESSWTIIKEKYSAEVIENFQQQLRKYKHLLFVGDEEIKKNRIDLNQKVTTLTLNVTRKCNLKCDYCFEDNEFRMLGNMPFEVAQKAINKFFTDKGTKYVIIFTGGEPLLNFKVIKQVVEYVNSKEMNVVYKIKTNATLMDDEKMEFLIEHNFHIQISLDGCKEAHDTHRKFANGEGSFEIVDEYIQKFEEKNYGKNISLSGTLTHQTMKFINDSYSHLNNYRKIRSYDLKGVMPNSHEQYAFDSEDYKTSYLSNIKNNKHSTYLYNKLTEINKFNICGIGIWNITIDVDGKIYPCYRMCGDGKYIMGDLELLKIPFKLPPDLENIYRLEDNKQCSKCYLINVCKMGCYTDKLMHQNDVKKCFHPVNKSTEKIFCNEFINKKIYLSLNII